MIKLNKKDKAEICFILLSMIDISELQAAFLERDYFKMRSYINNCFTRIDVHHIKVHASVFKLAKTLFNGTCLDDVLAAFIMNDLDWNYNKLALNIDRYVS